MECCGHDGTYAMKVEGFEAVGRVGQKAFDGMKGAGAEVWATDCPLAALQFQQHAGKKPLHPMSILARAYRRGRVPAPPVAPAKKEGGDEGMKPVERQRDPRLRHLRGEPGRRPAGRDAREGGPAHPRGPEPDLPLRDPRDDPLPDPGDDAGRADRARGRHPPRDRDLQRGPRAGPASWAAPSWSRSTTPPSARRSSRAGSTCPGSLYAKLEDGRRVRPTFDARQVGEGRVSSVQYLKFAVGASRAGGDRLRPPRPGAEARDGAHRGPADRPAARPRRVGRRIGGRSGAASRSSLIDRQGRTGGSISAFINQSRASGDPARSTPAGAAAAPSAAGRATRRTRRPPRSPANRWWRRSRGRPRPSRPGWARRSAGGPAPAGRAT